MAQKEHVILRPSSMNQEEFFNSVFNYGNLSDSPFTHFPVFVVLYLKLFEIHSPNA